MGDNIKQKIISLKDLRSEQNKPEKQRDQIKFGYTKNDLGSFDVFLKTKFVKDVQNEIERKEEEIKRFKNIASLKQLISSSPLASNFKQFSISIGKTLDTSAEKNIKDHMDAHWKNTQASKNFLADGVTLLKDELEACVFCGQDLSPVKELIYGFKKVFGDTYKEIRQEIERVGEDFYVWIWKQKWLNLCLLV